MSNSSTSITPQQFKSYYSSLQVNLNLKDFRAGDTVVVSERIFEDKKSRIQKFTGVILRRSKTGVDEHIIVRKEGAGGVYVEKMFFVHSPLIEDISILRHGKVRRAYLTYQRKRSGKAARIKERKVAFVSSKSKSK